MPLLTRSQTPAVRERAASRWQGPRRAAVAVFVLGALVVWLVRPIGDPCPYLASLPAEARASSSPSLSPPGSRTCTYTVAAGAQVEKTYVPWLDWIVVALLAAAVAGVVRGLSPAGRSARRVSPAESRPRVEDARRTGRGASARDAGDRERARAERQRARRPPA